MKILIITGIYPPDIGGPASYVPAIAEALSERTHEVTVLTLSERTDHADSRPKPYRLYRIKRTLPRLWRMLQTVVYIIRLGRGADVLYVNGLALEAGLANALLQKPAVQKIVGDLAWERARTFHGISDSVEQFQERTYGYKIELTKKMRAAWVACSDLIIVPSSYLQQTVLKWGIPLKKTMLVYNAVERPKDVTPQRPLISIPEAEQLIVSVGRLVPWKGFDGLIGVIAEMPHAGCLIVGEGPERTRIESLIAARRLEHRVKLTGQLERGTLFGLLEKADAFVLNSTYEGLPHIVLEAMQAGVPVIATEVGGTGELVQHDRNGLLIPPGDEQALRQALETIFTNRAKAAALAASARETLRRFAWPDLVTQTEQALQQAAGRNPSAHWNIVESDAPYNHRNRLPALFISTTRYTEPPDPTLIKKWEGLRPLLAATVIAFGAAGTPAQADLAGARWHLLSADRPRIMRYISFFLKSFAETFAGAWRDRYCAVIAQSPYEALAPALALLPWKLLRSRNRPRLIVEIHSDWKNGVMLYHRHRLALLEKCGRRLLGSLSLRCADAYRAISDYCRELLPAKTAKPVFVFPTYTDLDSFKAPEPGLVRQVTAEHPYDYFFFAGMLLYLKGVPHLLRAFRQVLREHPDTRLIIAGTGPEAAVLMKLAEELAITHRVLFAGHIEQNLLAAYIKNARAFVMPSLTEGLGRVAIEAQLLSRPVIASRVGGIPEILVDGETGIMCEPGDESALCAAMTRLLADPALAGRMGAAGRERVLRKFDYSSYYQSYRDMVETAWRKTK